jgi:hypothetical protein
MPAEMELPELPKPDVAPTPKAATRTVVELPKPDIAPTKLLRLGEDADDADDEASKWRPIFGYAKLKMDRSDRRYTVAIFSRKELGKCALVGGTLRPLLDKVFGGREKWVMGGVVSDDCLKYVVRLEK